MATSFDFRALRCFTPPDDAAPWSYVPREPDLQRASDGRPLVTLIELGASGYVLFNARWGASAEDLEALRAEIARRTREGDPARIRLAFAALASPRCHALVGDGHGAFRTVAASTTSGLPPYDAVFNLFLQDDALAQAKAALRGERGCLAIEYVADLQWPVRAKASFHARREELAAWLASRGAGADGLAEVLERAVESGAARVVIDAADPQAIELAPELHDNVLSRVAELLPRLMNQGAPGEVDVAVALEQVVSVPTRAFTDVGALVSAHTTGSLTGGQHVAN